MQGSGFITSKNAMAQVWSGLQNLFKYRIPDDVVNKVTDSVFDNLTGGARDGKTLVTKRPLTYGRLHEALTAVFKKINETVPGTKCIVPTKDFLDKILKESGIGKREEINREEFSTIVRQFSDGRLVVIRTTEVVLVTLVAVVANGSGFITSKNAMAQVWSRLQNLFKYRIPDDVVNKVTDNVFDNLTGGTRDGKTPVTKRPLTYGRLHEALTAVFKKINETVPGTKCIVPSKDFIDKILKESGIGKREEINREEFSTIVRQFSDGRLVVTRTTEVVLVTLVAVVANVILLPKVGILIAKVPPSIFFTTVALVALLIAHKFFHKSPPSRNQ